MSAERGLSGLRDLNWKDEISGSSGFGDDEDECINRDQPDGALLPEDEIAAALGAALETEFKPHEEERRLLELDETRARRCRQWRMERLAWYSDAHRHDISDYGIHIERGAVGKVLEMLEESLYRRNYSIEDSRARRFRDFLPLSIRHKRDFLDSLEGDLVENEVGSVDRRVLMFGILYKIYAHELCHGWVEDLCSLVDFVHEENEENTAARRYALTMNRLNAYIFLEESLCNTAAHALLDHQLRALSATLASQPGPIDPFNVDVVMDVFREWMRSQPRGYRDFDAITGRPQDSGKFKANLVRLLKDPRIYGYQPDIAVIRDLVEGFFGGGEGISSLVTGHRCEPDVYLQRITDEYMRKAAVVRCVPCEVALEEMFGGGLFGPL